jgi:hypothetical protein
VVAPDLIGQIGDAKDAAGVQPDEQRKERAVQDHISLAQQGVVALRAGEEARQFDERGAESIQIACISHLYVAPRWL